jgi:hypothetical protein
VDAPGGGGHQHQEHDEEVIPAVASLDEWNREGDGGRQGKCDVDDGGGPSRSGSSRGCGQRATELRALPAPGPVGVG